MSSLLKSLGMMNHRLIFGVILYEVLILLGQLFYTAKSETNKEINKKATILAPMLDCFYCIDTSLI